MKKIKLKDITLLINAELKGNADFLISSVNSVQKAGKEEITFIGRDIDISNLKAGAVIVSRNSKIEHENLLFVDSPYQAFAVLLEYFFPRKNIFKNSNEESWISKDAKVGKDVTIGPFSFIGENSVIGANVCITKSTSINSIVTVQSQNKIFQK